MAIVIGMISQKGGVGKSTLARLIAREYAANDWRVKIADLDTNQGTSFMWQQRRMQNELTPEIAVERYRTAKRALEDAPNYDLMVVDGEPKASKDTLEIARLADLLIIPTGLAVDDLQPTIALASELKNSGVPRERIAFAMSKVGTSEKEFKDAVENLEATGFKVLKGFLQEKTGYRNASDMGLAASETKYQSLNEKAEELAQSIMDTLHSLAETQEQAA